MKVNTENLEEKHTHYFKELAQLNLKIVQEFINALKARGNNVVFDDENLGPYITVKGHPDKPYCIKTVKKDKNRIARLTAVQEDNPSVTADVEFDELDYATIYFLTDDLTLGKWPNATHFDEPLPEILYELTCQTIPVLRAIGMDTDFMYEDIRQCALKITKDVSKDENPQEEIPDLKEIIAPYAKKFIKKKTKTTNNIY